MRLVFISDTHCKQDQLQIPDGDVLVHCGDATILGYEDELVPFIDWWLQQPHQYKVFVAGNHDTRLENTPYLTNMLFDEDGFNWYLDGNVGVEINGLNFWGGPWTPAYGDWAFQYRSQRDAEATWTWIPDDTDVLITHGPPLGILDANGYGEHCGCAALKDRVFEVKPKIHAFGHIHESAGRTRIAGTEFINASQLDGDYKLVHEPVVVDL